MNTNRPSNDTHVPPPYLACDSAQPPSCRTSHGGANRVFELLDAHKTQCTHVPCPGHQTTGHRSARVQAYYVKLTRKSHGHGRPSIYTTHVRLHEEEATASRPIECLDAPPRYRCLPCIPPPPATTWHAHGASHHGHSSLPPHVAALLHPQERVDDAATTWLSHVHPPALPSPLPSNRPGDSTHHHRHRHRHHHHHHHHHQRPYPCPCP